MACVVMDAQGRRSGDRGNDLRLSRLEVAGEVRREAAGEQHPHAMPPGKQVPGDQVLEAQAADLVARERTPLRTALAQARAYDLRAVAGDVERRSIGGD